MRARRAQILLRFIYMSKASGNVGIVFHVGAFFMVLCPTNNRAKLWQTVRKLCEVN